MPAFVSTTLAPQGFDWIKGPAIAPDPSGFDSASGRLLYRGTLAQLLAAFTVGGNTGNAALPGAPGGSIMYCLGVQGEPDIYFDHVEATIGWRGIAVAKNPGLAGKIITYSNNQTALSITLSCSSGEQTFPQQRDGRQLIAGRPYCPRPGPGETEGLRSTDVLVTGGGAVTVGTAPWRVRILHRVWQAEVRGISIGTSGTMIRPPKLTLTDPERLAGGSPPNWDALPDPLITWSEDTGENDGWFCASYQPPVNEYPIGGKVLGFWTASYLRVRRKGP